jgi:predicted Zn-dependent peptidase
MDLRERRSLTYGAYSRVYEGEQVAPFRANSAVRNEVTAEVMAGFFEHLQRIVTEPAVADEVDAAKRYLIDRFPLDIDTAAKIAHRVANLRIFGLPDNYWDGYREQIAQVTPEAARQAAKRYITPDKAVIVVVGRAADVKPALEQYGQITVIDIQGNVIPQSSAPTEAPVAAEPSTTTKE